MVPSAVERELLHQTSCQEYPRPSVHRSVPASWKPGAGPWEPQEASPAPAEGKV